MEIRLDFESPIHNRETALTPYTSNDTQICQSIIGIRMAWTGRLYSPMKDHITKRTQNSKTKQANVSTSS